MSNHNLEDLGETTDPYVFPQPVTANTLEALNLQTSESSTQTSIQEAGTSHNVSSFHPEPTTNPSLDIPLFSDWGLSSTTHLDFFNPILGQDSSPNLDQPMPSNATSSFSDEVFEGVNALMAPQSPLLYPPEYAWQPFPDQSQQFYYDQNNLSLLECLQYCCDSRKIQDTNPQAGASVPPFPRITDLHIEWGMRQRRREAVTIRDVASGTYDVQGIDWPAFRTSRATIRRMRRRTYVNHTNLLETYNQSFRGLQLFASAQDMKLKARADAKPIKAGGKYFHFSHMNLQHQICIPHFQLRHIVSASSKNAVFFPTVNRPAYSVPTTGSQITNLNPDVESDSYIIDSAHVDPNLETPKMQKIYALSAKNDVLVAGGLAGEYAYKSLSSDPSTVFTSGMITHSELSSTNHVHTYLSRQSGLPRAVFSSNDSHIHTLDLTTNKFISRHDHVKYVNCSATSPDTRLRVLVRDAVHPLLVEADTGKRIGKLKGHKDFGFACDWSADGRYIATGAQDGLIQIFDLRMYADSPWRKGPVQTLLADLGGVRNLAFSPADSTGKPVLLMAESADFVHIVDASDGLFAKKQTVDFFGEIAGVTFEESGERFWVGIADPEFGGLMEFEREKKKDRKFVGVGAGVGKGKWSGGRDAAEEEEEEDDGGEFKRRRRRKMVE